MDARSRFQSNRSGKAWQRLIREQEDAAGRQSPCDDLDLSKARVRLVTKGEARRIILRYEWLGTMSNTFIHYGLFFGAYLGGALCIGRPPGRHAGSPFGLDQHAVLFAARGACANWTPPGSASKLIAYAVKDLRGHREERVLMAYADEEAGEIGTVYQAAGWLYLGQSPGNSHPGYVSPAGRVLHNRSVNQMITQSGGSCVPVRAALEAAGWRRRREPSKHRYAVALDRETHRKLLQFSMPYPKRAATEETGSSDQEEQAGQNRPGRSNTNAEVTHGDEAQ